MKSRLTWADFCQDIRHQPCPPCPDRTEYLPPRQVPASVKEIPLVSHPNIKDEIGGRHNRAASAQGSMSDPRATHIGAGLYVISIQSTTKRAKERGRRTAGRRQQRAALWPRWPQILHLYTSAIIPKHRSAFAVLRRKWLFILSVDATTWT